MPQKILVADDDLGILESVGFVLEYSNYTIITTADAGTINDCLKELPDLILLDVWMGPYNGIEICSQIKSKISTCHIPVIVMSASTDLSSKAFDAGADDYIAKPFDINMLLSKIETTLYKYSIKNTQPSN